MRRLRDDRGASAVEYALLAGFIAAVIAVTVGLLGIRVDQLFATVQIP